MGHVVYEIGYVVRAGMDARRVCCGLVWAYEDVMM